jgi:hypothetical protein
MGRAWRRVGVPFLPHPFLSGRFPEVFCSSSGGCLRLVRAPATLSLHALFSAPGVHRGAREPPRDKHQDPKWVSYLGCVPILQKRPNMMKHIFENVRTVRAPDLCWPEWDADP